MTPIGCERETAHVVAYDSRWPDFYESEASLIRSNLGVAAPDIAHIGSTAVPGLEAKPIIDIMLAIPCLRAPKTLFVALADLGYEHRPYDDIPDRLFFGKHAGSLRTHNLSVCEVNSDFWRRHMLFRDRLRSSAELSRSYGQLKSELAVRHPTDLVAYTNGKNAFVASALERHGA
jgi:GrpB-like predicted nucleotidyltransferase (UPF0157 family)